MYIDPLLPLLAEGPRRYRAWPLHERVARIEYHPLSRLLTMSHAGDAHVGAYSVPSVPHRLSTTVPAYERVEGGVPMMVFLFDLDCSASHRATGGSGAVRADDAWWRTMRARIEELDRVHPGLVAYRTRGGARIVMRPAVPHVIATARDEIEWKRLYLSRLAYLSRRFSLTCDPSISDWTRVIRLPHITREGVFERVEMVGDPRSVGIFDYEPDEADDAANIAHVRRLAEHTPAWSPTLPIIARNVAPTTRRRVARAPREVASRELDAGQWEALARDLGRALQRHHGRHLVHRALAGACYARGVPLDRGPALAEAICVYSRETDDRPQVWQTTADRVRSGQAVEGYGHLAKTWPDLAAIVDTALPADGGARACRDELDARRFVEVPAAEASTLVRRALEAAAPGLQVVRITEGAGKTRAAAEVLRARAEAVAHLASIPSRAKTVYVAPSHAVAREMATALRGVRGVYLRSPMAVSDGDTGAPACRYHVAVERLVRARHAASTWCDGKGMGHKGADDPCPHRDGCAARERAAEDLGGAGSPAVYVTVHALLGQVLGWAGPDALVVIDEDPQAVTAYELTREALQAAADAGSLYMRREAWRAPVLRALAAGLERGQLPTGDGQLLEVHRRGCEALADDAAWLEASAAAYGNLGPDAILAEYAMRAVWYEKRRDTGVDWRRRSAWAPLPVGVERRRAFGGVATQRLVDTSATHAIVAQLAAGALRTPAPDGRTHEERAVAAVEVAHGDATRRVLRAVVASPAVAAALHRTGPTVLLDATADLTIVGALAGAEVPTVDIRVSDGDPVTRRLLYWSGASRRGNLEAGAINWNSNGLLRYLRVAVGQCVEAGARRVGVFAWKTVADALRAREAPEVVQIVDDVRALGAELVVGHYGAARGRNDWASCDGLVSIGDPKPNVGATRAVAAVLGISADHAEVYRRATAAEVSQVAGRLRAPWRTAPAVHVHVGTVPPSSWDSRAAVLDLPPGVISATDGRAVTDAVEVYGSARVGGGATGVSDRHARRLKSRGLSHAGNACSEGCHRLGPISPVKNISTAAHVRVGDNLENKAFPAKPRVSVAPRNRGTSGVTAESLETTPVPAPAAPLTAAALVDALGGAAAVASLLGITRTTPYHWVSGARPIPPVYRQQLEASLAAHSPAAPTEAPGASPAAEEPARRPETRPGVVRALPDPTEPRDGTAPRFAPITVTARGWS